MTYCNPRAERHVHSSKAICQSSITDNGPSIVGQAIEEPSGLESGQVEGGDEVPGRRPANLEIALIAQVPRVTCAGGVDQRAAPEGINTVTG